MGRKGPRAKTKTVLKPVKQWDKHGSMPNSEFLTFLNKNHPNQLGTSMGKVEGFREERFNKANEDMKKMQEAI